MVINISIKWKFRKFNENDKNNFLDWRKHVARREKTKEYYEWEYFNGPWGPAETTLAVDKDLIVGQYSTQRYEAFYFGEKMMASLSFDTGTHPDYRRQGIFKTIGDYHFKEEGKQGIHFSTGFPNENFWPGGKKFGWHALCPIPLLENRNILDTNIDKSSNFEIKEIKSFGDEFKGFSEDFKDDINLFLNRTQRYLNWRFVEKPNLKDPRHQYNYYKYQIFDKTGEMLAYFVTKHYNSENQKILHLIDFLLPNDEKIYFLILNFLKEEAKKTHVKKISLFLNKYHPFKDFLIKYNFNYVDTNRFYIVRYNTNMFNDENLMKEKNHYFTMGDSDIF